MEVGDTEDCSVEDLELMIMLQSRALAMMARWFLKAAQIVDPGEASPDGQEYGRRVDKLCQTAIIDAKNVIAYEDRTYDPAGHAEDAIVSNRLQKLESEFFNFAPGRAQP